MDRVCGVWAILLLGAIPGRLLAQTESIRLEYEDFGIGAVAGAFYFAPQLFGITPGALSCLPCDPASLPAFDRWVVAPQRQFWRTGSDAAVVAMAAVTWWDLTRNNETWFRDWAVSAQSAALAVGTTQFLKRLIGRPRPVLYTDEALSLPDPAVERRSWPSGHTSAATALATSYLLTHARKGEPLTAGWVALGGAVTVGVLRIAAARHFPSDVLGGLVVGAASAFTVHSIHF
ncbi:MAG: phosphatase PAP2 family protein [Gemmatimonadota bacterium]|nr:phosphatase PAP2 family protein [Gemmatimonadota bacterium]